VLSVLKPYGNFLIISHNPPEKWLGYLEVESYNWQISVFAIPRPVVGVVPEGGARDVNVNVDPVAVHVLYVCKKLGDRSRQ
jgi:hypothetical protein